MDEPLFPEERLAAIMNGMPLPQRAREARFFGRHRSGLPGESPEFQDFRAYRPGDDLRRVDWNVYRRSGKLFLRRFRALPEMRHLIILDNSRSMQCRPRRIRCAWRLAALIGGTLLNSGDPLSLRIGGFSRSFSSGGTGAAELVAALKELYDAQPETPRLDHPEKEDCYIISDFMDPDGLAAAEKKLELLPGFTPIRVYERREIFPELATELRLVDSESLAAVVVRPDRKLLERYRDNLRRFDAMLKRAATRAGARVWDFDADWNTRRLIRQTAAELFRGGDK